MARYSAFVLDDENKETLVKKVEALLPAGFLNQVGWEVIAHHCTVNMGGLDPDLKQNLGFRYELEIDGVGINERVIAVRVSKLSQVGQISKNKIPHITVAVNREANAKPVESNNIRKWEEFPANFSLFGTLTEVR
jgi:hypothetical protein